MLDLCVFVCLFVVVLVLHEFTTPRGSGQSKASDLWEPRKDDDDNDLENSAW